MHRVVSAALLVAICFILPASAQRVDWERTAGPYGGTVTALETVGDRLFAGTLKGLFVSLDGGRTWERVGFLNAVLP